MERYGIIKDKRQREIVLLRGSGCVYKKCAFCDYHYDKCDNEEENFLLNKSVLDRVTGIYGDLEIINSGSVFELDKKTLSYIKVIGERKGIKTLHFESHYLYRNKIAEIREYFKDFDIKLKLGLETFDYNVRENYLKKGIDCDNAQKISENFDEANFLFGIGGQTEESMRRDIELGLRYFERICINIMCKNSTEIAPDKDIIQVFNEKIYPEYIDNRRIDILIENTDFGVGR